MQQQSSHQRLHVYEYKQWNPVEWQKRHDLIGRCYSHRNFESDRQQPVMKLKGRDGTIMPTVTKIIVATACLRYLAPRALAAETPRQRHW
jgi:hypothetical protein